MTKVQDERQAPPQGAGAGRNLEDDHYRRLVTSGARVHISCVDGQLIEDARIKDFGTYALLVESDDGEELVWKHAIITMYPARTPDPAEEERTRSQGGAA